MERYKFRDVPKGKRLSHFFTYYSWHLYAVVFTVVVAGYLLYLTFLAPKTDASILWVSSTYSLETDGILSQRCRELGWDNNADGKSTVTLQHAEFGESFETTSADSQIALMTILSAGETDILFVSEAAFDWGCRMDIFGTYADMGGWNGAAADAVFAIPCESIPFFADSGISYDETMYLVISKPQEDPERLALYENNMQRLRALLECEDKDA